MSSRKCKQTMVVLDMFASQYCHAVILMATVNGFKLQAIGLLWLYNLESSYCLKKHVNNELLKA